jgi:hypothetical protein
MAPSINTRDFNLGFFSNESTMAAIEDLASASRLTLFVGAGLSVDLGVPWWAKLVRTLLRQRLDELAVDPNEFGLSIDQTDAVAAKVINATFQIPAASMVDQLFINKFNSRAIPTQRNSALRDLLYTDDRGETRYFLERPSLTRSVLELAAALKALAPDKDIHIITTNYDDSMREIWQSDQAFAGQLKSLGVRFNDLGSRRPPDATSTTIPVVHVHGRIPRTGRCDNVVFSEPDYVDWMNSGKLRDYLQDRFQSGHVLTIGTSLRDYNIITYLKRTGTNRRRYAVLPVQGDELYQDPASGSFDLSRFPIMSMLQDARGVLIGLNPLHPNFFGQVFQFIYEIRLRATHQGADRTYIPYIDRVALWWKAFSESKYQDDDVRHHLTKALQALVAELTPDVPEAAHLKLELWIRPDFTQEHDPRVLELWCSSQSMWLSHGSHWPHQVPISSAATAPASISFAHRSTTDGYVANRSDERWTHFIAVPIMLDDDPYLSVPVGVVVMLMHAPEYRDTPIPSYAAMRASLTAQLLECGVQALTPVATV